LFADRFLIDKLHARRKAPPVQGLLRHSDVHTTLQLYSQSVSADRLAAQGTMPDAMGVRPELVN
jgi:hypothetical protein